MERSRRRASTSAPIAVCPVFPHIGILDSWLPVLWELKHRHPTLILVALLPKDTVLQGVHPGDVVADLSESLFDRVIRQSKDGGLSIFGSFQDALEAVQHRGTSRFHAATPQDELPDTGTIALRDFSENVRLVCFDIKKKTTSSFFRKIFPAFRNAKLFSMPHGIDLRIWNSARRSSGAERAQIAEGCIAYLQSPQEVSYYCEKFGLQERNLRIVGVVRHAARWVETIKNFQIHEERPPGPYIFIASRKSTKPARFGLTQKRDSLKDLSKLARELNCKLVIRRHPGESVETVYEEVLGADRYGTHWMYSSLHPFILGNEALFCVTFRSCVALDMAVLGTPTIEFFDFEKSALDEEPTEDRRLFITHDGQLTSFYQLHGLVLGARNFPELKVRAEEILNDREGVSRRLTEAQRELYTTLPDPIAFVADDIEIATPSLGRPKASSFGD